MLSILEWNKQQIKINRRLSRLLDNPKSKEKLVNRMISKANGSQKNKNVFLRGAFNIARR
jgi:hypothetical protein